MGGKTIQRVVIVRAVEIILVGEGEENYLRGQLFRLYIEVDIIEGTKLFKRVIYLKIKLCFLLSFSNFCSLLNASNKNLSVLINIYAINNENVSIMSQKMHICTSYYKDIVTSPGATFYDNIKFLRRL